MMWGLLVLACSVAAEDGDSGVKAPEPAAEVVAEPEPAAEVVVETVPIQAQQQAEPWAILLEEVKALPQVPIEAPQEAPEPINLEE